jgi:hypothetical protein
MLRDKLQPESTIGDLITDLNQAFQAQTYGPDWSFIEAGILAEDEHDTIVVQTVIGSKPSTFTFSFSRVKTLILDTPR